MTDREFLMKERSKRLEQRKERIKRIYDKSEGLIPEDKREFFLTTIKDDNNLFYPIGFHANQALNIIAYLNNEEMTIEAVYLKFQELEHKTALDELTVAEMIRDYSARGPEFFTRAYESLKPRLISMACSIYVHEDPEFVLDMIHSDEPKMNF